MQIADACFYKGKKLYEKGKFDEAVLFLREAALSEPDNASMQMLMGSCCLNLGYTRDCIEAFTRAADLLNDSAEGQFALGFACAALDRYAEAVAPLRKAIQADSGDIHAFYWLGLSLTETGDMEGAIEAFGQVVLLDPDNVDAYIGIGHACLNLGRYEEAVSALRKSLDLGAATDTDAIHFAIGQALGRMGRHAEAAVAFKNAYAINPDFVDAYFCRGLTCIKAGDMAGAYAEHEALHYKSSPRTAQLMDAIWAAEGQA